MPLHEDGPRPWQGAEAEGQTGQDDRRKLTCDASPGQPAAAADTWRAYAPVRLSVAAGVRREGPLGWLPTDPPPREDEVTIARRKELSRRSAMAWERRWREQRQVIRYWSEAA
jgi:hypothetical protein